MTIKSPIIPNELIYEMDEGRPIFYRGYKEVLKGEKQIEEIMGSSYLQSLLVSQLVHVLMSILSTKDYLVLTNELGILFKKYSWRSADIAIYSKASLKGMPLHNKYMTTPPEIVIEVDTKADFSDVPQPNSYYRKKTNQLLEFGVKKVIWIFTETKEVMVAAPETDWLTHNWQKDIHVIKNATINIAKMLDDLEIE